MTAENKAAVKNPGNAGSAPALSELKRLGKYEIEKKIGAGGMGAVFLGRDTELKRTVALKVLPRDKAENPTLVKRFRAEAQAAAQLRHPNIVAVYDSGEADGYLYIAMEYVEGQDLFEMVTRRGTVPIRRSIDIIKQVSLALQHAYEQNIVHRDIKPSNLLIRRDGVVKLTDLGLARSIDDTLETNITRAGTTVGTVDYMSPEQARSSKSADIRSDLYSLGCTWYQMLTGSPPYPDGSVTNKLQAHAVKPVPDPRDKNPQVPEGLTAVIRRMMAKKPEDRYQTPADLLEELSHATLTHAAISREIFSDDENSETDSDVEEGLSDDGYFDLDDSRKNQETPDQLPNRPAARKKTRQTTAEPDIEQTQATPGGSRSHAPRRDRHQTEPEARTHRSSRVDDDDDDDDENDDPAPSSRIPKPRTAKPEARESTPSSIAKSPKGNESRGNESRGNESRGNESRGNESKGAKPKGQEKPGPKPLPPKRQPIETEESEKAGIGKELRKYVAAGGGLILVIVGLGWLFSGLGGSVSVDSNPFHTADPAADPVVPINATVNAPGTPAANAENPAVTVVSGSPANPSPEASVQPSTFDIERIPDWASRQASTVGLQTLTVGPGTGTATHFTSLDEALQKLPDAGGVIKLLGAGPFLLPQVELTRVKQVVVMAATVQDRPTIALRPGVDQKTAGIRICDGNLELRGLHFSVDRQLVPENTRIIDIVDGQLAVHQCSFTSSGTSAEPIVAMSVQSTIDATSVPLIEPNVLIDQVVVRGDGLTGVSIRRANVDAIVRDCLMVSGAAPVIEIAGHIAAAAADVTTVRPRRILRVLRSTLSAQKRVFEASVSESGKPPQTAVFLGDSVCAAQGIASNSAALFAAQWPQARTSSESWLTRMTWTSNNSLYLGFEQLIDLGASFKVADATTWQRVWNTRVDARQFQKLSFPDVPLDDLSLLRPQDFDFSNFSYREVKGSDGNLPGCPTAKLIVPDSTSQQRVGAFATRPALPAAAVKPGEPAQVRKIDLRKEDLGLLLNRTDWPSGTLFEASGAGVCLMTPASVEGRSFRIVFRQADGIALKVLPTPPKTTDAARNAPPGLITVTGGTMELTNAVFEGTANAKLTTEWFIHASNATVILNGCRLLGAETEGSRQVGLIRWTTTSPEQSGASETSLVVRDSFLAGTGVGIREECAHGTTILRNSVLAVRGDALDLRPRRAGNALLSVLDAEGVTFSATNAVVRFEAAPGSEPVTTPFRLFMERCVAAPPLAFKSGEAANACLLQCVGPAIEQKQLEWWGASNGIARLVVHMIRRDGDMGAGSDERTGATAWKNLWSKGHSIRMLTGDKGVYLAGELPLRWKDLKPGSFSLHKNSQAASWADGGRSIGANTAAVEEFSIAKKGADTAKPISNSNKKNPGF